MKNLFFGYKNYKIKKNKRLIIFKIRNKMEEIKEPNTKKAKSEKKISINTSNKGKIGEFQRMFNQFGYELDSTNIDLKEIIASHDEVVAHKASSLGEGILVEDTSLEIEGKEEEGINIKWILSNMGEFIGKKATWIVLLGIMQGEKVNLYKGVTEGEIVEPSGEGGFGFDPIFRPIGSEKTLAQEKKDETSARFRAIKNLCESNIYKSVDPIKEWKGKWQNEDN